MLGFLRALRRRLSQPFRALRQERCSGRKPVIVELGNLPRLSDDPEFMRRITEAMARPPQFHFRIKTRPKGAKLTCGGILPRPAVDGEKKT
jgi:hypothetical protein